MAVFPLRHAGSQPRLLIALGSATPVLETSHMIQTPSKLSEKTPGFHMDPSLAALSLLYVPPVGRALEWRTGPPTRRATGIDRMGIASAVNADLSRWQVLRMCPTPITPRIGIRMVYRRHRVNEQVKYCIVYRSQNFGCAVKRDGHTKGSSWTLILKFATIFNSLSVPRTHAF